MCPYSLDVPGGVQLHVHDLAGQLIARGHQVRVLAPADDDTSVPDFVDRGGGALAVPYNGSVARLSFGPLSATRVHRWLERGGFDLVHLHEPQIPSLSLLALQQAQCPMVATFHTSIVRSRALSAVHPLLRPALEQLSARIAVSEDARRTLVEHLGGDAVVIPNGVVCDDFAYAATQSRFTGTDDAPTVAFLGRIDEPRKGLSVLARAWGDVLATYPRARLIIAGRGKQAQVRAWFGEHTAGVEFLGPVDEPTKRSLLASVDVYVAPQTGGESFGIVLVEAMSAGTCVLASDLGAFTRVIDDGSSGILFPSGDPNALAARLSALLADRPGREALAARAGLLARRFDWSVVTARILAVYDVVLP